MFRAKWGFAQFRRRVAQSGNSKTGCRYRNQLLCLPAAFSRHLLTRQSWEQFQSVDKDEVRIIRYVCRTTEGVPLVEFMYHVFTRMPGEIKLPIWVRCSVGRVPMTGPFRAITKYTITVRTDCLGELLEKWEVSRREIPVATFGLLSVLGP